MIINLTQHTATPEQQHAGVADLVGDELAALKDALTFDAVPSIEEIENRAKYIAELAYHKWLREDVEHHPFYIEAMIGGAPFLMASLEAALLSRGINPIYAFSRRESVSQTQPDGGVRKVNVFRHVGFVRPCSNTG